MGLNKSAMETKWYMKSPKKIMRLLISRLVMEMG